MLIFGLNWAQNTTHLFIKTWYLTYAYVILKFFYSFEKQRKSSQFATK